MEGEQSRICIRYLEYLRWITDAETTRRLIPLKSPSCASVFILWTQTVTSIWRFLSLLLLDCDKPTWAIWAMENHREALFTPLAPRITTMRRSGAAFPFAWSLLCIWSHTCFHLLYCLLDSCVIIHRMMISIRDRFIWSTSYLRPSLCLVQTQSMWFAFHSGQTGTWMRDRGWKALPINNSQIYIIPEWNSSFSFNVLCSRWSPWHVNCAARSALNLKGMRGVASIAGSWLCSLQQRPTMTQCLVKY